MVLNSPLTSDARTAVHGERQLLGALINDVFFAESLFDALPDVVFFVKDIQCRYVLVNRTLAARCGFRDKSALLGRNTLEVFGTHLGSTYLAQDKSVLACGINIHEQLELHLYPNRDPGWCLTHKVPLRDASGAIVGLAGISRDLAMPDKKHPVYQRIAAAIRFITGNYDQQLQLSDLEEITKLSAAQIERYFKRIFYLSPRQMIIKTRLEAATKMLASERNITEVAVACGYNDHSAFTRQFKATTGVTPSEYRALVKSPKADSRHF